MAADNTAEPKRQQRAPRQPSKRWATFQEIADHFCVSETTVREGRGVFARLRRVPLTPGRIVVPRADFERLDREMERAAVALVEHGGK
jgi:hypothetical protein